MIYLPIAGTWGAKDDEWFKQGSWFARLLQGHGIDRVGESLRFWSTALGGTWGCGNDHLVWDHAGEKLTAWQERLPMRDERLIVIAHSWGGAVAAYALSYGFTCDTLITIDTPHRPSLNEIWAAGVENRRQHLHLKAGGRWFGHSMMRVLGSRGWRAPMATADRILPITGGHSGIVTLGSGHTAQWHDILESL